MTHSRVCLCDILSQSFFTGDSRAWKLLYSGGYHAAPQGSTQDRFPGAGTSIASHTVSRKQILEVAIVVLIASMISALVAYRHGARRSSFPVAASRPAMPSTSEPCVDFSEAGSSVGRPGCIKGRVLKVYTSRADNTFLDFCQDYRSCPFTAVIFSADRSKFEDLSALSGRMVEIRGPVTSYRNRPEIVIHDPDQIRVVP